MSRWRDAGPLLRAEMVAWGWELFSALLFISAVVPAAFDAPWSGLAFLAGLAFSSAIASYLVALGPAGYVAAGALRTALWLLAVIPLIRGAEATVLVVSCGFGLMAGGLRHAIYRRILDPPARRLSSADLGRELRGRLSDNAMVAGIVGGHVLLLFSVAFLRTASRLMYRAWWEMIPVLAILGTAGFTLALRPTTGRVVRALRFGPEQDSERLSLALKQAQGLPRVLSYLNFMMWVLCLVVGAGYMQVGPERWQWPDAAMQLALGLLFAWGVSFFQRGWHEDTMAPAIWRLQTWTGQEDAPVGVDIRRRMLSEFGRPLLFALTMSVIASIGLYRSLAVDLRWQEDFNAIIALTASFCMLVLAVGAVFLRAAAHLARPLSRLAAASNRVANGKLQATVPRVTGPTEVVQLGRSIERMRGALAHTIEELQAERAGLETHVEQRTAELRRAMDELKRTQTALIQGERLALIGELVAGVAHEINNPLNAIAGSVSSLERIAREVAAMVSIYRREASALAPDRRVSLKAAEEELDIEGALDDLAMVAKVVRSASARSVDIVGSLKSFSRLSNERVESDLRHGIRETLALLAHRSRAAGLTIDERLDDLPQVVCCAGEINQVFMNLLSNAIHAAGERAPWGSGALAIIGEVAAQHVAIKVMDNGGGVEPALEERIFDPFFTTKSRADGTGLGLSISREIMRRHGGSLTVAGHGGLQGGASFECRLPRHPTRAALSEPGQMASLADSVSGSVSDAASRD